MKKSIFWLILVALTALSMMPTTLLPPQAFNIWDKAQHALGFSALTLSAFWAFPQNKRQIPILLLLHGGLIELAQTASGWRHGDWLDLLADAIGIGLITGLWALSTAARQTLPQPSRKS